MIAFAPFVYFVHAKRNSDIIIIIIIIIISICVIAFMKGINNYIPEKNHVSSVYSVAAVPYLQFVLHVCYFAC